MVFISFAVVVVSILPQLASAQPVETIKSSTLAVTGYSVSEVNAYIAVMEQRLAQQAQTGIAIPVHRGSVPVPPGYVYNPSRGARHDYCTNSPDQFPIQDITLILVEPARGMTCVLIGQKK